jgi:hypothetical protein
MAGLRGIAVDGAAWLQPMNKTHKHSEPAAL